MTSYSGLINKCGCTGSSSSSIVRWVEISSGYIKYYIDESKVDVRGSCKLDSHSRVISWPNIGPNNNCIGVFTEDSELYFSFSDY